MKGKYKMTGCARFFIFLLIFAPLAFFGVSYFQGESPGNLIKSIFNIESTSSSNQDSQADDVTDFESEIKKLNKKITVLEEELAAQKQINKNLTNRLKETQ